MSLHDPTTLRALARLAQNPLAKYCPFKPHPKQAQYLSLDDVYELLYGGAAGGAKSVSLLMGALKYVHVPGYRALLLRKTYKDLALPGAIMDMAHGWLRGTDARWDGDNYTFRFPPGSSLTFGYCDGPHDHLRYQGTEFQHVAFDELTQWATPTAYLYLHSRVGRVTIPGVPHRMRGGTNPGGPGLRWVKERFIDHPEDRLFLQSLASDNPSLNLETYNRALSNLDAVTRAQLRDGLWIEDESGLVYHAASVRTVASLPEGGAWSFVLALDFGSTDDTSFVVLAFRPGDPAIYVVSTEKAPGMTVSPVAEHIRELEQTFGGFVGMVGDPAQKQVVETLRREFYLPIQDAEKTDKIGHVRMLNDDVDCGRLVLLEGPTEPLLAEWRGLLWKNDLRREEHPRMPNHCADACLYGWRAIRRGHRLDARPRQMSPEPGTPAYDAHFEQQIQARLRKREAQRKEESELLYG